MLPEADPLNNAEQGRGGPKAEGPDVGEQGPAGEPVPPARWNILSRHDSRHRLLAAGAAAVTWPFDVHFETSLRNGGGFPFSARQGQLALQGTP